MDLLKSAGRNLQNVYAVDRLKKQNCRLWMSYINQRNTMTNINKLDKRNEKMS